MSVRVAALAAWLWLMVQATSAQDFGWLASLLSISAFCALVAPLGIPYLFFADRHSGQVAGRRWQEALGAISLVGPVVAAAGATALCMWLPSPVPAWQWLAFMLVDVVAGAILLAAGLWAHAAGKLAMASGLPAALTIARMVAAGAYYLIARQDQMESLSSYLAMHAVLVSTGAALAMVWMKGVAKECVPRLPALATRRMAWRYALMGAGTVASSDLDKPLVARVVGLQQAGYYALAYRICAALAMPGAALAAAMLPRWAGAYARGEQAGLRRSFIIMCLAVACIGFVLAAGLRYALRIFPAGSFGFYPGAWFWMQGLAWLGVVIPLHQIATTALLAIGRPLARTLLDFGGLALLASALMVAYPLWGRQGVVWTCIVVEAAVAMTGMAVFAAIVRPEAGNDHESA